MADYKELLRRAISVLPENNGAARRAVYEKARSALVGQLRAISPPLPARDITQHRLQLEDCIRQVEQEASEAVISLGREPLPMRVTTPAPVTTAVVEAPLPVATPPRPVPAKVVEQLKSTEPVKPVESVVETATQASGGKPGRVVSIEDIIAQAAATTGADVSAVEAGLDTVEPEQVPPPVILVRTDADTGATPHSSGTVRPMETALKAPSFETRRSATPAAASARPDQVARPASRVEPMGGFGLAHQQAVVPVDNAVSGVREVEVEQPQPNASEAEGVIASAIEVLDREARGEPTALLPEKAPKSSTIGGFAMASETTVTDEGAFAVPTTPAKSGSGLTIFLIVFALLLAGAGGAGFWAWREGYVDLDQMFGRAQTAVVETTPPSTAPTLDPVPTADPAPVAETAQGPGNTATNTVAEPTTSLEGVEIEDRLEPTPEAVVPTGAETVLPDIGSSEDISDDRLPGSDATVAEVNDPAASVDPSVLAGSQSLLLEARSEGDPGAVPFSGTVEWTEGTDELGLPTLIGRASIPARNLGVDVTIRKNSDPSLPASHLLEVDFDVSDTFIGGTISNLPGVLLKDQELVPGTPLVGASARVVGNSFLFALSASETDTATNTSLLEDRRWMDLAIVYGTGRNAILTLEKDDAAQALFQQVFTAWAQ